MLFLILIIILVLFNLYKRYFPIKGVHPWTLTDIDLNQIKIIDVRDFNEAYKDPIKSAINIPIAYLKRNLNEIPNGDLHVVGLSLIEINIGIRILRKKGFRVIGYTVIDHNKFLLNGKLFINQD